MGKLQNIVSYSRSLADAGTGVDFELMYGMQCADLTVACTFNETGVRLYGNAADLLNSAEQQGLSVVWHYDGVRPKAGWLFVMAFVAGDGVNYGHTGVIIEDSDGKTLRTIEQNIDGNADFLEVGGPARYNVRDFSQMMGYIVLDDDEYIAPKSDLIAENGTFTLGVDKINVRRSPALDGEIVAVYEKGMSVKYDSYLTANGYRWISYIGASGKRNYMAIGQTDENGKRISLWGELA